MKRILILSLALGCSIMRAHCWSAPGHEAIAEAAMQMLKGTPAEAKVNAILNGEDPTNASIWLDLVREHHKFQTQAENDEAAAFNTNFHGNANWHFCNFIVGSTSYSLTSKYASNEDVVHALENAIAVLEGANSKMTKKQALRVVFHLVGDIHQPLHCITGFYDTNDMQHPVLLTDVPNPKQAAEDRGGNQLYYTESQELHALWDFSLPNSISPDVDTLASKLVVSSWDSQMQTAGDYHHWAEVWAGDSMVQANAAYDRIQFNSAAMVDNPRHPGQTMLKIDVSLPNGIKAYKQAQKQRAEDQLTKAAVHLAQLLNKINFN